MRITLVGKGKVGQVPNAHVRPVENLVLLVVGDHVVLDKTVVDHGRLDCLGLPLNL